MPVTKADVVRLVKEAAESVEEKDQLLALAGDRTSLWDGLDEDDVVGCLRAYMRKEGSPTTLEVIKEALRQHAEELAEQERKSVKTIRLVGSKASSSSVKEASKRLRIEFDHAHALTPSFKQNMGAVAEATSYEWFADEDNKYQVESVCKHLQKHYAPPGVKVIAVTGVQWLEANFEEAHVVIEDTYTDFVFLAEEAVELYELMAGATGSERLLAVLPGILGLYKTKTSEGLFSNLSK